MRGSAAIGDAAFAALLQPLLPASLRASRAPLAVAMSGGADSTALLHLTAAWGAAQRPVWPVVALTVDHGVRVGSDSEARSVTVPRGVRHTVLTMEQCRAPPQKLCPSTASHGGALEPPLTPTTPPKPSEATLRNRRLEMLRSAAVRAGCGVLLLGHHAEDQLETVLQRLVRASGVSGLGGISSASLWSEPPLLRPLLAAPKAALIATCVERGARYVTDPSNAASERGRIRSALERELDLTSALMPLLPALRDAARDVEAHAARLEAQYVACAAPLVDVADVGAAEAAEVEAAEVEGDARSDSNVVVVVALEAARAAEHATAVHRMLTRALHRASGSVYPPRRAAVDALLKRTEGGLRGPTRSAGCIVTPAATQGGGNCGAIEARRWREGATR